MRKKDVNKDTEVNEGMFDWVTCQKMSLGTWALEAWFLYQANFTPAVNYSGKSSHFLIIIFKWCFELLITQFREKLYLCYDVCGEDEFLYLLYTDISL